MRKITYQVGHGWQLVEGAVFVDEYNQSSCAVLGSTVPKAGDVVVTGNCTDGWEYELPEGIVPGTRPNDIWGFNYHRLVASTVRVE